MLIVRVELHSAITGQVTEIARMRIGNVGGTDALGDYRAITLRGRCREALDRGAVHRTATITRYPRLRLHVWHLVARALDAMGYR